MSESAVAEAKTDERAQALADMRALLDFIEQHPEIAMPTFNTVLVRVNTRDDLAAIARLGSWEKVYNGEYFSLVKQFGTHTLDVFTDRSVVCRKVITGTRTVPATAEHVEEVTEWVCEDGSLLSPVRS